MTETTQVDYKPVLLVDTLSSTNDFGVELAMALDSLVNLTVFTIKGTQIKAGQCRRVIEAFPEYWGRSGKLEKLADQIKALVKLATEIWRHRKGVVHVQFFRSLGFELPLYIILRPFVQRLVLTAHNALPHERKWWHKPVYKLWYRTIDRIHVLSDYNRSLMVREMGVNPDKIHVVPHGSYERFKEEYSPIPVTQIRKELSLDDNEKVVLFYGAIRPYKGVDRLVRAFAKIATPNVRLIILGECDAAGKDKLAALIRKLHISSQVIFQPRFVPNQELSNFIAVADIIVFPYIHIYQSGALLLAMTYGKPVIVSDLDGFREYVSDSESGVICKTEDPKTLAFAIDRLLQDIVLRSRLGKRARELCETDFSWSVIGRNIMRLY